MTEIGYKEIVERYAAIFHPDDKDSVSIEELEKEVINRENLKSISKATTDASLLDKLAPLKDPNLSSDEAKRLFGFYDGLKRRFFPGIHWYADKRYNEGYAAGLRLNSDKS